MLPSRVNYFGHAAVASWSFLGTGPSPGKSLGSMLPDFATMIGVRLGDAVAPDVAAGIALHHATDSAFHQAAPVLALMRELDDRLGVLGCARGPRRATAHIGTELLLDATLLSDQTYRASFLSALDVDPALVTWREPEGPARFNVLLDRMRTHGVPEDLRQIESITHRLHRMIQHRPLLAPNADDLRAMATGLAEHRPRVETAADTVLRAVRSVLYPVLDPGTVTR
jgi:acyl carrier protein phosphodiesterase